MKTVFLGGLCLLILIGILSGSVFLVIAVPISPTSINISDSDRRTNFDSGGSQALNALAGNVTELTINTTSISNRWQGYYGNISGTITLDNANNFSLYSWVGGITARGEILAADAVISNWSGIRCANVSTLYPGTNCSESNVAGGQCLNITELQSKFGGPINGGESVNATFTSTAAVQLDTGTLVNCSAVNLYVNDQPQTKNWTEVLLVENNTETVVFASILNTSTIGFDNVAWDFQMIVGENGDTAGTKAYYFYVELY